MATPEIVTLYQTKEFLRVIADDEDGMIMDLIVAATEAVLTVADGFNPEGEPSARIRLAIMTHVAQAYLNREDGADLPKSAARLVHPLRSLTV
ncbi:head-tail connector protein [Sphingomonas sp. 28-63-12]|uniref:head-tail connector protein n=1 Tax=Sphingomonas sp. 28-63-12 TaxID=1970434 RepID=UPI000BC90269|nr:MAG: hypothetical protein B7Y47_10180 [Sphingomonas sp. 28-63-12]